MATAKIISDIDDKRVKAVMNKILPYLKSDSTVVDIGSGNCKISKELQNRGFVVKPVDIKNKSEFKNIIPVVYDGKTLLFSDNTFDVALLITVLHHTKNPIQLLKEAKRVAKTIILMEDTYKGRLQKYLTFIMDSLVNLEFIGHPHTNKTVSKWEEIFKELNLRVVDRNTHNFWIFFTSATFFLAKG